MTKIKWAAYFTILSSLALAALSACATVPMSAPDANVEGKRFQPPPPNMAALYVYRESPWASGVAFRMSVDERTVGSIIADTWLRLTVAPGQHEVICDSENTAAVSVTLAAGEVRFVRATGRMGWHMAQCTLDEVPADQGRHAVLAGNRAAERGKP